MARKRDSASKRLARVIESTRRPNRLLDLIRPAPPSIKLDWADKRTRQIAADVALKLTDSRSDTSLRKAFKEFNLDPQDPFNWRKLLQSLADVQFNQRAQGAPPKWDLARWQLFQEHVAFARKRVPNLIPKPTGEDIADYIHWRFNSSYKDIQLATIRRYLKSPPPAIKKLLTSG